MKRVQALAILISASALLGGCGYGDHDSNHHAQADIDLNAGFEPFAPGKGTGVFIEYGPAGHWHIFTSCDTLLSQYACDFQIFLSVPDGSAIRNAVPEDLESDDAVHASSASSAEFDASTSIDFDGLAFDTDPGQALRVEAILDGERVPQFMYWISRGATNEGAPSDPIDFLPNSSASK